MAHRCDPSLTEVRVLELLVAAFDTVDGDLTASVPVINDLEGCQQCILVVLGATARVATDLARMYLPDARMAFELNLAAARAATEG